jgi:glycosyltransferase involved in cell wall biosynthesis
LIVVTEPPGEDALAFARAAGLDVVHLPARLWGYERGPLRRLLDDHLPDIVHMHSVFVPKQATLARQLRSRGIPYVITPHGGLIPAVQQRGRLKKAIYRRLIEQPRFMGAAAVGEVTPNGEGDVRAFVPGYRGPVRWIPNPVSAALFEDACWKPDPAQKRLVFLGRFDVVHKGIDILVETARLVPEAQFELYGNDHAPTLARLEQLRRSLPPNVAIQPPIFNQEKVCALTSATMYIQMSRWEALSISILEAMYAGVPPVITEPMSMAPILREHDAGLVVPLDPARAAPLISAALNDPAQLRQWSHNARRYARATFAPRPVAETYIRLYEEALGNGL